MDTENKNRLKVTFELSADDIEAIRRNPKEFGERLGRFMAFAEEDDRTTIQLASSTGKYAQIRVSLALIAV